MRRFAAAVTAAALLACAPAAAPAEQDLLPGTAFDMTFEEIGNGVVLAQRPVMWRYPVVGNAVILIGDDSVALFDGGGGDPVSAQILAEIRRRTDKPLTHVVLSHWHIDHLWGIDAYAEAFPNVQFVAHPWTKGRIVERLIPIPADRAESMESFFASVEAQLDSGLDDDGAPLSAPARLYGRQILADADDLRARHMSPGIVAPNVTTTGGLTIDIGGKTLEVHDLGRGNTPGDLVVYVPEDRLLLGGDVLPHPTPFGYPTHARENVETIKRMMAFDFAKFVPGHGDVQTDRAYADRVIAVYSHVNDEIERLAAEGLGEDEIRARLDLPAIAKEFAQGDETLEYFFNLWFSDPVVGRSLGELSLEDGDD